MGTNYGSTKDAFRAMHDKYAKHREKMVEQWAELEALEQKKKNIMSDVRLTNTAKMEEITEIGAKIYDVKFALEQERNAALRDLKECMRDAETSVGRKFKPNPATIRHDAIELVNSGALTLDELLTFCDDYNVDDLATRAIIGKRFIDMAQDENAHMSEEQRQQLDAMGYTLQKRDNRFSDHLAGLMHVFDAALRTERELADGIAENVVGDCMNDAWAYAESQMNEEYGITDTQ